MAKGRKSGSAMTALAMACALIASGYCHGSHTYDVTQAIARVCRHDVRCRAALVVTAHNEFRWRLTPEAYRFSPWGLTSPGLYDPERDSLDDAARTAIGVLRRGLRHCRTWPRAFAWYVRGEQRGRCPRVGPESRQRWRQMRGLLR